MARCQRFTISAALLVCALTFLAPELTAAELPTRGTQGQPSAGPQTPADAGNRQQRQERLKQQSKGAGQSREQRGKGEQRHHSNWAVLINVSRYWFNYRHAANTLSMYRTVKRLGIPDDHIILMTADDMACNARNAYPSEVHNDRRKTLNLYGERVEVDYRNYEVTVDAIVRVLTGRHDSATPRSKRLLSDADSNVLVYLTGHGGNQFMKVQDHEEISAQDLADAIAQMQQKKRFQSLLLMIDTCQGSTMFDRISAPGVLAAASSGRGENSYSHHHDSDIGVAVIDRFTYSTLQFLEGVQRESEASLAELYAVYTHDALMSTFVHDEALVDRSPRDIKVTDFFGNVAAAAVTECSELPLVTAPPLETGPTLAAATTLEAAHPDPACVAAASHREIRNGRSGVRVTRLEHADWRAGGMPGGGVQGVGVKEFVDRAPPSAGVAVWDGVAEQQSGGPRGANEAGQAGGSFAKVGLAWQDAQLTLGVLLVCAGAAFADLFAKRLV